MQGYVDTAPTRLEDNLGQILDHAFRTLNEGSNSVIFIIKKNEAAFQDRPDRICAVLFTDGRSINSIGELKLTSSSSCHVNVIVGTWGPLATGCSPNTMLLHGGSLVPVSSSKQRTPAHAINHSSISVEIFFPCGDIEIKSVLSRCWIEVWMRNTQKFDTYQLAPCRNTF